MASVNGSRTPSATPAPRLIGDLPSDLLLAIFAHLHELPRLRVVSLVCKRWRTLAIRSIKRFGTNSFERRVLTSLEVLDLRDKGEPHPIPATLTSLSVRCRCPADCPCSEVLGVTGLRKLSIDFRPRNAPPAVIAINNSSSLTELSISLLPSAWLHADCERDLNALFAVPYPRLTHLSLSMHEVELFVPFVASMASQLVSLALAAPGDDATPALRALAAQSLPRLRTLRLEVREESHLPAVLRAVSPSLTALHLRRFNALGPYAAEIIQLAAPFLVELETSSDRDAVEAIHPLLARCTRLAELYVRSLGDGKSVPALPSLRRVVPSPTVDRLHLFPALEALELHVDGPAIAALASAPCMRGMRRIDLFPTESQDAAAMVCQIRKQIIPIAPNLDSLHCGLSDMESPEVIAELDALLHDLNERLCEAPPRSTRVYALSVDNALWARKKYPWVFVCDDYALALLLL